MLKAQGTTQLRRKATWEKKNYQLSPELMTYALLRSFSHTSYGICHVPLSHITPYVPVSDKPLQMQHTRDLHIRSDELKELVLSACVAVSCVCVYIVHEIVLSYFQDACCTNVQTCAYVCTLCEATCSVFVLCVRANACLLRSLVKPLSALRNVVREVHICPCGIAALVLAALQRSTKDSFI